MPARASDAPSWRHPTCRPAVLKMLRDAFNATMKDPEFIAETKQRKLDLAPVTGDQLEALIKKIYATPKPIVAKVWGTH
jgi:tripartite-type tricarboxylate transporter receptor subunit TctC